MIRLRKSNDRGHADHGWLKTYHTFSFGDYYDPAHMHFRSLRVMNEDFVAPGKGFPTHPHRDMEIVTYVLEGELEHRDSMGNGEVIHAGEFQRMTAGTGVTHSEFNPSATQSVHLYQIWLFPGQQGLEPSYEQRRFDEPEVGRGFRLVASPDAAEGSLVIHQDARIYLAKIPAGETRSHGIAPGRHVWLQVLRGEIETGEHTLLAGDGAAISDELAVMAHATRDAEVMLFNLV